jgi:hypothetical protein
MNVRIRFLSAVIPDRAQRGSANALLRILAQSSTQFLLFRLLIVACQGATFLITWPLWQVHQSPPMLPALPLPYFDMSLILLLSLGLILIKPVQGVALHTALVIYAMLIDQTRIQPEVVSLLLLLWGTLPSVSARAIGRAHLISLWFWAGLNKLLSPAFLNSTGPGLFGELLPRPLLWLRPGGGYIIALAELAIGLLAIFPRTRKLAGWIAFGLHGGILLTLSPLGQNRNESVWPWNLALALAGLALIVPWKEPLFKILAEIVPSAKALVILILLSPAGWFVGITDAYLAHHLYSSDVPRASSTALPTSATWGAFEVPLPPEHRLFEQYFRLTCQPGDEMTIRDRRWWFQQRGQGEQHFTCMDSP